MCKTKKSERGQTPSWSDSFQESADISASHNDPKSPHGGLLYNSLGTLMLQSDPWGHLLCVQAKLISRPQTGRLRESLNSELSNVVRPAVEFNPCRVACLWSEADPQSAGKRREGSELRAGRTETMPATVTCWRWPPGTDTLISLCIDQSLMKCSSEPQRENLYQLSSHRLNPNIYIK